MKEKGTTLAKVTGKVMVLPIGPITGPIMGYGTYDKTHHGTHEWFQKDCV